MLVYSPRYNTDLSLYGIDKPFALDRGQRVLQALERDYGKPVKFREPVPVSLEEVLLVHTQSYLDSLSDPLVWLEIMDFKKDEYCPDKAHRPITDLLHDIKLKCGGTLLAAELSLTGGLAANLGGGYHHAFPDQGRGYCVLNDIAIAICSLKRHRKIRRAMVVDLDFHQGDGTAVIFRDDPDVFTLSVHSQEGWPDEKQVSSLDVGILSHEADRYLEKTSEALIEASRRIQPDLAIFVAGSDPYELDVLPGTRYLKLTLDEMRERDELVIDFFWQRSIPLTMVFAGGYGPHVWEVHYHAVRHLLQRAGTTAGAAAAPGIF